MRFSTSELAVHLGGKLVGPDVTVTGVSIDSRTIRRGQLFVPIVADRDGHEFVTAALAAGAAAYLTARAPVGGSAVVVADTSGALMELGVLARTRVGGVIGITGSVGKTTTKDLVAACLRSVYPTAASEKSFNNELGLPLTLAEASERVRWVVLEMGARGPGHIRRLARVARPDVGIVTSVAAAHVEFFGDLDGVSRAKSELVAALPETGVAILNWDDHRVRHMAAVSSCEVLGYAVDSGVAEVRAEDVSLDSELRARFRLMSPWGGTTVRLALHGAHQVPNALAAATAALWCGVSLDDVAASLSAVRPSPLRMEVYRTRRGATLIADCYNANPASSAAALRSLASLPASRRLALLGVMAELGDETVREHRGIAELAEQLGIEIIGFETDLYGSERVDGVAAAVGLLEASGATDALLVKGSRVARLEQVVEALVPTGAHSSADALVTDDPTRRDTATSRVSSP